MAESTASKGGMYNQVAQMFRTVSARAASTTLANTKPILLMGGNRIPMKTSEQKRTFYSLFKAIPWMTYRKNFLPIQPSTLTSDAGWGCMLRSAQMMIAHAFQRHYRGWNCRLEAGHAGHAFALRRQVLRKMVLGWFHDSTSKDAFFSIHKMVQCGLRFNKEPGEWYGPTAASLVLQELCSIQFLGAEGPLKMFVSQDRVVDEAAVDAFCASLDLQPIGAATKRPPPPPHGARPAWRCALLLVVPLRIGLDTVNQAQGRALLDALALPHSVGVIGGRPRHSLYFVGAQESNLICLDPHTVQKTVDWTRGDKSILESHSCSSPSLLPLSALDPTLALGFYVRDRADLARFCRLAKQTVARPDRTPLFTVATRGDAADTHSGHSNNPVASKAPTAASPIHSDSEDEEYVLL